MISTIVARSKAKVARPREKLGRNRASRRVASRRFSRARKKKNVKGYNNLGESLRFHQDYPVIRLFRLSMIIDEMSYRFRKVHMRRRLGLA